MGPDAHARSIHAAECLTTTLLAGRYAGSQGKRHRLREAMIWEDEPSYFEARMLQFEPDLPYELVYPRGTPDAAGTVDFSERMSVEQHFALVHHQLKQIRDAMALAQRLNRVLILPRLVCGLDRWWAPHSGIIPGSSTRLPLLECPADHIIDLERMRTPETLVREHSITCNPRMPKAVLTNAKHEKLPLVGSHATEGGVAKGGSRRGPAGSGADGGMASHISKLLYGAGSDEPWPSSHSNGSSSAASASPRSTRRLLVAGLVAKLEAHEASLLVVSGPLPDFREVLGAHGGGGVGAAAVDDSEDPLLSADHEGDDHWGVGAQRLVHKFEADLEQYASLWCCNQPPGGRGPGHIWYDFFWDVLPHRDRHRRLWTEAWRPVMGP